jgi:phage terminase large subunit-like protein
MVEATHRTLSQAECEDLYAEAARDNDCAVLRWLAQHDLFFLLVVMLGRPDAGRPWIFARCREIEAAADGTLFLLAREHYKSTMITFASSIQAILRDPDVTIGIFSHTRPAAKGFLTQIKTELETNAALKALFPDILWADPAKESPRWSMDDGIIVKRSANPKESTVEAWGLVDGQPIGKHFRLMIYDDVVTAESCATPGQIEATRQAWELSLNLGSDGGRKTYVGTRYHQNDAWATMMKRGTPAVIHPATIDGSADGEPVLMSREFLGEKRRLMGPYTFSCQMLLNPVAEGSMGFRPAWLCHWYKMPDRRAVNCYITVDPSSGKKKGSGDYSVILVHGLGADGNYYLLDGVRDRLNLSQRADELLRLVRKWSPICVGYEEYGMQADIEHIRQTMEQQSYRFNLVPLGGRLSKSDRIMRLIPIYESGRMWIPCRSIFVDTQGKSRDLVAEYLDDEYGMFPVCAHDDMLDCHARILDQQLGATFPRATQTHPFAMDGGREADRANGDYDVLKSPAA